MQYSVYFLRHKDKIRYVVPDETESGVPGKVRQIVRTASDEIIHPDDGMSLLNQIIAQMRTQKTRGPSNQYNHIKPSILQDYFQSIRSIRPSPVTCRILSVPCS